MNIVQDGSYNFHPAWSPDGAYLAFLSDRDSCASWIPGDPGACDPQLDAPPTAGQVYVLETATGEITRVSEDETSEPPRWIDDRLLAFSGGDPLDLLNPSRTLWLASMPVGVAREIRLADSGTTPLYISESWSQDGQRVLFQNVENATSTELVVMDAGGARLDTIDALSFARFGMQASWAPDGERIAVGGSWRAVPLWHSRIGQYI